MGPYIITFSVFILSFIIFPFFFLTRPIGTARKIIPALQVAFFAYWNVVFWGFLLLGGLFKSLAVPRGSDPEGSVFMLYFYVTPIFVAFIISEMLIMRRNAKREKKALA
jgi:hypothetical protein